MGDDFVRDPRKGKAILEEEEEPEPKPIPKDQRNIGNDAYYLKNFGPTRNPEALVIGPEEPVKKIQFRFRNKELNRILGIGDARIKQIQKDSGATIGIITDAESRYHRQLFLELLGTADEVKVAELLIKDVIKEAYRAPYVPKALMPTNICNHTMPILLTQVVPVLGIHGGNIERMETESRTWIEVDTYPEGRNSERRVNVYGQGLDVTKAIVTIQDRIKEYERSPKPENELAYDDYSPIRSPIRVEEQKGAEEDDSGNKEGAEEDDSGNKEGADELGDETGGQ